MSAPANSQRRARSPLFFIFLTVFIDLLGFGIVLPLLPVYSLRYAASQAEIGLLFASFSAMQFVFAPMWGRLSDRIGRRPVLIGGLCGTACSYLLFAYADNMAALFVSRLLAGFFGANISTAQAYIADVTTQENRAKGMGLIGAAFGLGFTFGPLFGGELTRLSPAAPGFVAAGLSAAAALFGYLRLPEPPRGARVETRAFGFEELRHAATHGRIGILLVLSFLFIFAFSAFESMFTLFGILEFPAAFHMPQGIEHATLEDVIAAAPWAGRYLCAIGLIAALIQGGLIRRLVPRFGETALAVAGPLLLGLGFVVVARATSWSGVVVGCLIMPFGFGLNNPALYSLISRAAPAAHQGAYLGLNQSVASLARMSGPLCAGWIFEHVGARSPFWLGAGVLACSACIAWLYRARHGASFPRVARPVATESG